VEVALPIPGHPTGGSGYGLVHGVMLRRGERGAFVEFLRSEVPEPILSRLEAADDAVLRTLRVRGGMLTGRGVAAPDVAALGAASQVEPPPPGIFALDAAGSARGNCRINPFICHWLLPGLEVIQRRARMVVEWRPIGGIA
jgi:hypothetical protein